MKLGIKSQKGVAHLALIVVVVVAVVIAGAGFGVYKHNSNSKLQADAATSGASVCAKHYGGSWTLKHVQGGDGFGLYNYKRSDGKGCALSINNREGVYANLGVYGPNSHDENRYAYYAGPVTYQHKIGVTLCGKRNASNVCWKLTTN